MKSLVDQLLSEADGFSIKRLGATQTIGWWANKEAADKECEKMNLKGGGPYKVVSSAKSVSEAHMSYCVLENTSRDLHRAVSKLDNVANGYGESVEELSVGELDGLIDIVSSAEKIVKNYSGLRDEAIEVKTNRGHGVSGAGGAQSAEDDELEAHRATRGF